MSVDKGKFSVDGYVIVDLNDGEVNFDEVIKDVNLANEAERESRKLNPEIYHYNEYPRLIEAWRRSDHVKKLALHRKVFDALRALYDAEPIAFSTINFTRGTEQPLHSDYFHFGSMPELMLAGVWVALEDIHPDAGPLSFVPGSHNGPIVLPEDLGIRGLPKTVAEVKGNYTLYEQWVANFVKQNELKVITPRIRKGQAVIWAANLLHGSFEIRDRSLTRYSQVTHYHFEGCEFFYNPNFSTRKRYVYRDIEVSRIK
jgi:hypothetical protein